MDSGVFTNYWKSNKVISNQHPDVRVKPWMPNKQVSPAGIDRLVQPTERGSFFSKPVAAATDSTSKPVKVSFLGGRRG